MKTNLMFLSKEFILNEDKTRTDCTLRYYLKIPNYIANTFIQLPGWKRILKEYGLNPKEFKYVSCIGCFGLVMNVNGHTTKHKDDVLDIEKGKKIAYVKAQRTAFRIAKCLMREIKKHYEKRVIKSLDNSINANISALYASTTHLKNLSK